LGAPAAGMQDLTPAFEGARLYELLIDGAVTGSSTLHGKSIQRSVRRQTYSQLTTERGFSYSTAQRTSPTLPAQKSFTSRSVNPVSATSSAIRTRASSRSTSSGTGGRIIGMSRRSLTPV